MNLIELEIPVEVPVAHILVVDTCAELPGRMMSPAKAVSRYGMLLFALFW